MLNQQQRDTFRLALSANQNFSATSIEELNIDEIISDDQIVETRDTIEDFFKSCGRKLTRNGDRPETPRELNRTICGDLYIWSVRGETMYVMDFGNARASFLG